MLNFADSAAFPPDETHHPIPQNSPPLVAMLVSPLIKKNSFIHARARMRTHPDGSHGVYATGRIRRGEIVCIFVGDVLTESELRLLPPELQRKTLQLAPQVYLAAPSSGTGFRGEVEMDEADYFNHSCEPNLYLSGNNVLLAARDIKKGEELCYDYGTSDTEGNPDTAGDWICQCGSRHCRGKNDPAAYRKLVPRYGLDYVAHYIAQKWRGENSR